MTVIEVCFTIMVIIEGVAFIHRMIDFGLGVYYRKRDKEENKALLDNLQRLTFMITDLDSRVKELEKGKKE